MTLWGGRRVPFTLLGGYLGAGKTTIVNHVVRAARGRRIVVLVNDVGSINVDASLIAAHEGSTLTLTNGCVCCAIADDFTATLEQVRAMPEPPDHVLMELSGVAEPVRVAPWASTPGFRLDGIVVAADGDQLVELVDRRYVGETIVEQLRVADVVLLTKTDLADDRGAAGRATIAAHSRAPVVEVVAGAVDVDVVLGIGPTDAPVVGGREGHDAYVTSTVDVGEPRLSDLERLVERLPGDVLRAKGLVRCRDEAAPVEVHVVGRRRGVRARPDLPAPGAANRLVVIALADGGAA